MSSRLFRCVFPAIVFAVFLSACKSTPEPGPLYSWGSYESQVYAYLNGESREAQIRVLEADRGTIESSGKAFPPGFYAHLGLLYAEINSQAMAVACFEKEKALFPESAVYMDFLLRNYRR